MRALKLFDIEIIQGKTFSYVVRWEDTPIVYAAITAITNTAPVSITAALHGILNGWRAAVVSVKGMTQINALNTPPKDSDYMDVTVVDANTVTLNVVNAAGFKPYTSGGYLQYNKPVDLTGYTARMVIKSSVSGTALAASSTLLVWAASTAYTVGQLVTPGAGMSGGSGVLLQCAKAGTSGTITTLSVPASGQALVDGTVTWTVVPLSITLTLSTSLQTVTISIPAAATTLLATGKGLYDLELISAAGVVTALLAGKVTIDYEITT
jgi:hypothetical protein